MGSGCGGARNSQHLIVSLRRLATRRRAQAACRKCNHKGVRKVRESQCPSERPRELTQSGAQLGAILGSPTSPQMFRRTERTQISQFLLDFLFRFSWKINDLDVIHAMIDYADDQFQKYGTPPKSITRHMVNFFQSVPGARKWRQIISETSPKATNAKSILLPAYEAITG